MRKISFNHFDSDFPRIPAQPSELPFLAGRTTEQGERRSAHKRTPLPNQPTPVTAFPPTSHLFISTACILLALISLLTPLALVDETPPHTNSEGSSMSPIISVL